jgi:hypothetical protein
MPILSDSADVNNYFLVGFLPIEKFFKISLTGGYTPASF